jgi:excisionase family DNA binding protein
VNDGFTFDGFIRALVKEAVAETAAQITRDGATIGVKPRLLTVEQAAVRLGRTEEGARRLITSGRLPTVRMDRRVYIDVKDLDRLIEDSKTRLLC